MGSTMVTQILPQHVFDATSAHTRPVGPRTAQSVGLGKLMMTEILHLRVHHAQLVSTQVQGRRHASTVKLGELIPTVILLQSACSASRARFLAGIQAQ